MLEQDFMIGPFEIHQVARGLFDIRYGKKTVTHQIDAGNGETRQAITDGLRDCVARLMRELLDKLCCLAFTATAYVYH